MSYLAHHGVLGMKWGVRRYQNKDGSLTAAGIKRYQKENFREYKRSGKSFDDKYNTATKMAVKNVSQDQVKQLREAIVKARDSEKYRYKASDEYDKARRKAIKKVEQWYKQNDPNYLKNPKKVRYSHDFKKMLEGEEAELISKSKYKEYERKYDEGYNEVFKVQKQITKNILGKYGDRKIKGKRYNVGENFMMHVDWRSIMDLYKE